MQAADNSEVLQQIHEIGELLRLAQTPEGVVVRRAFLANKVELQELLTLIRELMAADRRLQLASTGREGKDAIEL
jgi:hypothetical protein